MKPPADHSIFCKQWTGVQVFKGVLLKNVWILFQIIPPRVIHIWYKRMHWKATEWSFNWNKVIYLVRWFSGRIQIRDISHQLICPSLFHLNNVTSTAMLRPFRYHYARPSSYLWRCPAFYMLPAPDPHHQQLGEFYLMALMLPPVQQNVNFQITLP